MDAALYVARIAFAAWCLVAVVSRCMSAVISFRDGGSFSLPWYLGTFAYAYLLLATLLTFVTR